MDSVKNYYVDFINKLNNKASQHDVKNTQNKKLHDIYSRNAEEMSYQLVPNKELTAINYLKNLKTLGETAKIIDEQNPLLFPGNIVTCDGYFSREIDNQQKTRMYEVYRMQAAATLPYDVNIKKNYPSENINLASFQFAGGELLLVPQKNEDYYDYDDWVELIGRQLAASNYNIIQSTNTDDSDNSNSDNVLAQKIADIINKFSSGSSSSSGTQSSPSGSGFKKSHIKEDDIRHGGAFQDERYVQDYYDTYADDIGGIFYKAYNSMVGKGFSPSKARSAFIQGYRKIHGSDNSFANKFINKARGQSKMH